MNGFLSLAQEILRMFEADQAMRDEAKRRNLDRDVAMDERHSARIGELVAQYGWPTIPMVGRRAAQAAWLLVLHADHDPDFQQQCLDLMRRAAEGEVEPAQVAYLEDRVRVNTGQPQLYGTQFCRMEGAFAPYPIEDEEGLDDRRAAMGLESFDEYYRWMMERFR